MDNESKLAEQILEELKNPKTERELIEISEIVKKQYSYENIANKYWKFIEECI